MACSLENSRPVKVAVCTIVGVVGDTHQYDLDQEVHSEVYLPYLQKNPYSALTLVVRATPGEASRAKLSSLQAAVRDQVRAQDPNEPIDQIVTMDQYLSDSI